MAENGSFVTWRIIGMMAALSASIAAGASFAGILIGGLQERSDQNTKAIEEILRHDLETRQIEADLAKQVAILAFHVEELTKTSKH